MYFTQDRETGAAVAIKVARPSAWSHKRIKREIKVQERLEHPNVPAVLARGDEYDWYATYAAECSLEELGQLPQEQWMYLRTGLLGVSSAVRYAHDSGFIHRDLSAGNILVFAHGWIVGDWGFVYEPPRGGLRMTQPLERFGTPDFMAPEMAVDPRKVGPEADVFSIGRLAAWSTGLERGESSTNDDDAVRWWQLLIDSCTRYEPAARWTMQDIEAHLRAAPVPKARPTTTRPRFDSVILAWANEECPYCQSELGRDQTERCLRCHASLAY